MALGDARRAGGQALEQGRRAAGRALEDARRASGQQMEATRRGKTVAEDINSLVRPQRQAKALPRVQPVGAIPPQRSRGTYKAPAATGTAGIASPLTEQTIIVEGKSVPDREYWPQGYLSSDGLFVLPAVKTLNMTDANGDAAVFQFADPQGSIPEVAE